MDRTFLYHETMPGGRIFDDEEEFNEAIKKGWVESPADIGKKPAERKKPQKSKEA